jgi:hypothetical protein
VPEGYVPFKLFCIGISGTSSANTTAKPLLTVFNIGILDKFGRRRGDVFQKNSHFQVPVDVAVKQPRTGVVSEEPNCDIVCFTAEAHDVTNHRIDIIVGRGTSAADNVECVPVQVYRMLCEPHNTGVNIPEVLAHAKAFLQLTGTPAGIVISTLLFRSRP